MRLVPVVVISSIGILAVLVGGYFMARRYAVSVELTRDAAANAKAREMQANELLLRLAASPKLTIGSQTQDRAKRGKKPLILAVVSRHVLPLIENTAKSQGSRTHPLLERLENVDVESVSYQNAEVPSLIAELRSVQSRYQDSALNEDMTLLIQGLNTGAKKGDEIVVY